MAQSVSMRDSTAQQHQQEAIQPVLLSTQDITQYLWGDSSLSLLSYLEISWIIIGAESGKTGLWGLRQRLCISKSQYKERLSSIESQPKKFVVGSVITEIYLLLLLFFSCFC